MATEKSTTDRERIDLLERRVAQMEEFIMAGQDDWTEPSDMLAQDSLIETIKSVVKSGFYVSTTSELKSSD